MVSKKLALLFLINFEHRKPDSLSKPM